MNFYFYDLETTGVHPFRDRIMQFGGQKVDKNLDPLSEVEEFYVKLSEDILPNPRAILTHKILPQTSNLEGLTEHQFLNWLSDNVYSPKTIYSGYNTNNFDDQFMRWLHWRNFAPEAPMFNPASLDIYKLVRLAADLRPEGLNWPFDKEKNRFSLTLTALTGANKIDHSAHRSAGDVLATIDLARLIKKAQPKLFDHFLKLLQSKFVKEIISHSSQPFLYSHYSNLAFGAGTTLATVLAEHPTRVGCFIIYDLRRAVDDYQKLNAYDLSLRLKNVGFKNQSTTPFSILDINKAPAIAPISALDEASVSRLKLDKDKIFKNWQSLRKSQLNKTAPAAYLKIVEENALKSPSASLEELLAKTKISEADEQKRQQVYKAKIEEIANLDLKFEDVRFKQLQLLYQARNFPKTLKTDQLISWEKYKLQLFSKGKPSGLDIFKKELRRSLFKFKDDDQVINILEELQLYIESIMPEQNLN